MSNRWLGRSAVRVKKSMNTVYHISDAIPLKFWKSAVQNDYFCELNTIFKCDICYLRCIVAIKENHKGCLPPSYCIFLLTTKTVFAQVLSITPLPQESTTQQLSFEWSH